MVNSTALTLEISFKLVLVEAHKHSSQNSLSSITCSAKWLSLVMLTHTFVFKSTPGAGFGWGYLEPFSCYIGIKCSVQPITNKTSDRVGCLCAILVLFARLFIGMHQSSHQRKFCNSHTIGCLHVHHSGNLSI